MLGKAEHIDATVSYAEHHMSGTLFHFSKHLLLEKNDLCGCVKMFICVNQIPYACS